MSSLIVNGNDDAFYRMPVVIGRLSCFLNCNDNDPVFTHMFE